MAQFSSSTCIWSNPVSDAAALAVLVNVSTTPPMVTTVSIEIPLKALDVCRTITLSFGPTEPATLVQAPPFIWYWGSFVPEILIEVARVMPVTVIVFELIGIDRGTLI